MTRARLLAVEMSLRVGAAAEIILAILTVLSTAIPLLCPAKPETPEQKARLLRDLATNRPRRIERLTRRHYRRLQGNPANEDALVREIRRTCLGATPELMAIFDEERPALMAAFPFSEDDEDTGEFEAVPDEQ